MAPIDPLFAYLSVLSVIQPARIQDIEMAAKTLLSQDLANDLLQLNLFREAHETARKERLVIQVRRGVYFTAPTARRFVRKAGLEGAIDNSRLFLMKRQRKRYS